MRRSTTHTINGSALSFFSKVSSSLSTLIYASAQFANQNSKRAATSSLFIELSSINILGVSADLEKRLQIFIQFVHSRLAALAIEVHKWRFQLGNYA